MMRKKLNYTTCTPIPSYIPRQLAVDLLHSHGEIITVNPLVIGHKPIKAPPNAPADEYYSSWYEVEERVTFIPGIGKFGSSKIKFHGCFHDLPWGLQTHMYIPAGVETKNTYRIAGNQPGEPRQPVEMGIGAPPEGLYLREDVEIKCNMTMASFIKKEQKAASKVLIERMLKKAELLEEGTLRAMFDNGRITTWNPNDRTSTLPPGDININNGLPPQPQSPRPQSSSTYGGMMSPYYENKYNPYAQGYAGYGQHPQNVQSMYGAPQGYVPGQPPQQSTQSFPMELPGDAPMSSPRPPHSPGPVGDMKLAPASQPPQHLHPAHRPYSTISELSSDNTTTNRSSDINGHNRRWSELDSSPSEVSRPTSYAPTEASGGAMRSPRLPDRSPRPEQQSFGSVPEEPSDPRMDGAQQAHKPGPYIPHADYAKT